jgi:hypothetical protein
MLNNALDIMFALGSTLNIVILCSHEKGKDCVKGGPGGRVRRERGLLYSGFAGAVED